LTLVIVMLALAPCSISKNPVDSTYVVFNLEHSFNRFKMTNVCIHVVE